MHAPAKAFRTLPAEPRVHRWTKHEYYRAAEVYAEFENPRGHLGFYIESQGGPIPYRVKIRGPSFVNLSVLPVLARDVLIADVPAIIGSIDIVMGEVDR